MERKYNYADRMTDIDVLKGLGILSVVLGHCLNFEVAHRFIYSYHMILFVFISGFLFHEVSIKAYVCKKIRSLYFPSIIIISVSLLMYPVWIGCNVLEKQSSNEFLVMIVKTLLFVPDGIFTNPLWFVPFIFGTGFLALILIKFLKKYRYILLTAIFLLSLAGVLGMTTIKINNITLVKVIDMYFIYRILVTIPFFFLGIYAKKFNLINRVNQWIFIPMATVILIANYFSGRSIDLYGYAIYGGYGFYPIAIIGLLFVVSLGKLCMKSAVLTKAFSILGKNSFWIMGGHCMVFKFIDGIIGKTGLVHVGTEQLHKFPFSFFNLWWLYTLLGCLIPIAIVTVLEKVKEQRIGRMLN